MAAALGLLVLGVGSASGAAQPHWQTLPVKASEGSWYGVLGTAAGRVWLNVGDLPRFAVTSARVGGRTLTSFASTAEGTDQRFSDAWLAGGQLVNCCVGQPTSAPTSSRIAPLLANGKVGAWGRIPGDPEAVARALTTPPSGVDPGASLVRAAATVGGRTVWAIVGGYCPRSGSSRCTVNGGGVSTFALCCTADGAATDVSTLLTKRVGAQAEDVKIGVDAHGRLWLAWAELGAEPVVTLRLTQIDPDTLLPLATKRLTPAYRDGLSLACADACRLVYSYRTGFFAWDGTRSVRILAEDRAFSFGLLGATVRAGKLVVAYAVNRTTGTHDVVVAHAAATGRGLKTISSARLPNGELGQIPPVGFGATSVVATATYAVPGGGSKERVVAVVLPG